MCLVKLRASFLPDTSRPLLPPCQTPKDPFGYPSHEQPAPIWTRSTPPSWPIFCLSPPFFFFLPSSVELLQPQPTGDWVGSPSCTAAYFTVTQFSAQANYTTTFSDLCNFSQSLSLFCFWNLWPCCLTFKHYNLEEEEEKKSSSSISHCWSASAEIHEWVGFYIKFLFFWTEFCTWLARSRLTYTTTLSRAIKTCCSSSFSWLYKWVVAMQ